MADLLAHMGVLDIQVVVAGHDFSHRNRPGLFGRQTRLETVGLAPPPINLGLEFLKVTKLRGQYI